MYDHQPHTYTGIKALEAIGRVFPNGTTVDSILLSDFSSIPQNQLGIEEDQLPVQPQDVIGPNAKDFAARVKDIQAGKPWWQGKKSDWLTFSMSCKQMLPTFLRQLWLLNMPTVICNPRFAVGIPPAVGFRDFLNLSALKL